MQSRLAIFLFFILLVPCSSGNLFAQAKFQNEISGRVTDAETGKPIFNANVFLANTTRGAATDKDGKYYIKNIPPGSYDLIFSMMGYELQTMSLQFIEPRRLKIDMKLKPRVLKGKQVQVTASVPREWRKNLKRFIKEFLGDTQIARECKILNPEVLDFWVDKNSKKFVATTDSILIVENRALGYRLRIILDTFRISSDSLIFATYPRYEELTPKDEHERAKWLENRNITYHGSFRHFISALARGRLQEEDFVVFDMNNDYLAPELLEVAADTSSGLKWFFCSEPLKVVYRGIYHAGEGHYFSDWGSRYPLSYLYPKKAYALIDTLGNVMTKFAFVQSGYWQQQRMASLLPFDYIPNASRP